jgi:hypothetical protein
MRYQVFQHCRSQVSNPQKLPIDFKPEVSFTRSIDAVRALSENRIRRDVSAGYIVRERIATAVRPNPPKQITNPVMRRFRPMSEWQVRITGYAARTGKTLQQVQQEQAAKRQARRLKAKGA